jgi:hypothetical protein
MFEVTNGMIRVHKKNTGTIYIKKKNYIFQVGDIITLTVKTFIGSTETLIKKEIKVTDPKEKIEIRFESEDTDLKEGEYFYDIRIDYANGDISTVIYPPGDQSGRYEPNFLVCGVVNDE